MSSGDKAERCSSSCTAEEDGKTNRCGGLQEMRCMVTWSVFPKLLGACLVQYNVSLMFSHVPENA